MNVSSSKFLQADQKASEFLKQHKPGVEFYEAIKKANPKPTDRRWLGCLEASNIAALLKSDRKIDIARYFPLAENLFALKRSHASTIARDEKGTVTFEMRALIKPHFVGTVSCPRRPDEEAEFQYLYRDISRRYIAATRGGARKDRSKVLFGTKDKGPANYGSGEMRELLIVSASTQMCIFNHLAKAMNRDTLVDTLRGQESERFSAFDLVQFICRATQQPQPTTAQGYIEFLCHGSPMIRSIFHKIAFQERYIGPQAKQKLLFTEDIPLLSRFYQLALNMIFVPTKLYHSGLGAGARNALIKEFNDQSSKLRVMGIAYDVGAMGTNCQEACCEVVVTTPAKNHGSEQQAYGRPIRVCILESTFDMTPLTYLAGRPEA